MNQLTVGDILRFIKQMQNDGMTIKEIAALPVYLGIDDELNGIHTGWYTNLIDPDNEDDADFIELINEDRCNIELKGKAILIS
jgi:DNA-binding transcriptional MerR regulator